MKSILVIALVAASTAARADSLVVGDDACPRHAVDIAAFATCDDDRVAAFDRTPLSAVLLPESRVPVEKRNFSGLYVDARGAHRLKHDNPGRVVLVDVRSRAEVGLTGQPPEVDVHVPYLETETPLRWDDALGGWAMTKNPTFASEVAARLAARGVASDAPVLVLCRTGERSARAADELAVAGYTNTVSVVDGFEGDIAADGRRSLNGWKNAELPWTARPLAARVYGAR